MKIIIIGAGISGLATYLFLLKHLPKLSSHEITIVEAYDTTKLKANSSHSASILATNQRQIEGSDTFATVVLGSGLGLSCNGLNVLRRIDADGSTKTLDRILSRGRLTTKWKLAASRGWELAQIDLASVDNGEVAASGEGEGQLGPALMIIRHRLWECLRDAVIESGGVVTTKKVVDIVVAEDMANEGQNPVQIFFSDGTTDTVDLVLGADGLRSVVRRVIFQKEKDNGGADYITPHYEGLAGIGGWVSAKVLEGTPIDPDSVTFTFGPNGFFGCGYMTPFSSKSTSSEMPDGGLAGWWSTYPESTAANPKDFDKSKAIDDVIVRHKDWKNPHVRAILANLELNRHSDADGVLDAVYPTFTSPPIPSWSAHGGRLVLIGDSAHSLQPSSGQGACQALEDSEAYVLLLCHYLEAQQQDQTTQVTEREVLSKTASAYTALRRPRVMDIYHRSQRMGGMKKDMNVVQEFIVYFAIWVMSFFGNGQQMKLLKYDVPSEVKKIIASQS